MLTSDLSLSWRRGTRIGPKLVDADDRALIAVAGDLIGIVSDHRGRSRGALRQALDEYVGVGTDYKVLRGLIKLLDDRCEFSVLGALDPSDVRRKVFLAAAGRFPATGAVREQVLDASARELGASVETIVQALYGDLEQNQVLTAFEPIEPRALLEAYNLAQAQALLYRAIRMTLAIEPQAAAGYRKIFDAIKAYRLIHTIAGSAEEGYLVRLDGPVSMFHRSQKYGIQMAVFLPALLACEGWRMQAEIEVKGRGAALFELSSGDRALTSDYLRLSADRGPLLEKLQAAWRRQGVEDSLEECREVLDLGEEVFVPDLVVTSPEGRRAFVEVLGFWTAKTIEARLLGFKRAGFEGFVLVASEEYLASRELPSELPANVVLFKSSLDPRAVRSAAAKVMR